MYLVSRLDNSQCKLFVLDLSKLICQTIKLLRYKFEKFPIKAQFKKRQNKGIILALSIKENAI
jgi:hypothetical protein